MGIYRNIVGHWLVEGDNGVSRLVSEAATFEHPGNLAVLIHAAMVIPEGGVVVDAGACIGDQTVTYSQMVGASGHVYAFEPHPLSYQALKRNTERFTNITAIQGALGAQDCDDMQLSMTPSNVGASFVGKSAEFASTNIEIFSLDAWFHNGPIRLDFIHLDAEGMESQILDGAKHVIQQFHPSLLIEVTDEWLKRYGSSATALLQQIAGLGYFSLMRMQPNAAQFDVLCIPPAKIATMNTVHELAGSV